MKGLARGGIPRLEGASYWGKEKVDLGLDLDTLVYSSSYLEYIV